MNTEIHLTRAIKKKRSILLISSFGILLSPLLWYSPFPPSWVTCILESPSPLRHAIFFICLCYYVHLETWKSKREKNPPRSGYHLFVRIRGGESRQSETKSIKNPYALIFCLLWKSKVYLVGEMVYYWRSIRWKIVASGNLHMQQCYSVCFFFPFLILPWYRVATACLLVGDLQKITFHV